MEPTSRSQAIAQGLKAYFTGKPCKHGHIAERILPSCNCIVCSREQAIVRHYKASEEEKQKRRERGRLHAINNKESIALYQKEYNEKNPEKVKERSKRWYEKNKDLIKDRRSKYREENKERTRERYKNYYEKNKQSIFSARADYQKTYRKEKYANDVQWKASFKIRAMIARVLNQTSQAKWAKSEEMIGYTRADLVLHLDGLLHDGMTWENFGKWHIDHIKPISLFIKEGVTDPSVVNALSNLQPLWAKDNFKKSSKYEP